MKGEQCQRWVQGILVAGLFFGQNSPLISEESYSRPKYEALPLPSGGLSIEAEVQDQLLDALASLARDFEAVSPQSKAKAVAVSRRIAPLHKETFVADYQLSRGVTPAKLGRYETLSEASAIVLGSAKQMEESSEKSEQWLALHLFDLLDSMEENGSDVMSGLASLRGKGFEPSWDNVFPDLGGDSAGPLLGSEVQVHRISLFSTEGLIEIVAKGSGGGNHPLQFLAEGDLVTSYFTSAFREGVKFLEVTRPGALRGVRISFETNTDHGKDFFDYQGPAAALPGLVALQALIGGTEIDPAVALAGDVNADGSIQPIYDVLERIEALEDGGSHIIGIPVTDYPSVSDALILDGPRIFAKHQIFTLKSFSDAVALSGENESREQKLQEAIEKFAIIQGVLTQPEGHRHLKHPSTITKLREVLTLAPNHLSARMLGLWATNQVPKQLSLAASLDLVVDPVFDLVGGEGDPGNGAVEGERGAEFRALTRVQNAIDPRLEKLTNAVIQYSNTGRIGDNRKALVEAAKTRVRDEYEAVLRKPAIREELMR